MNKEFQRSKIEDFREEPTIVNQIVTFLFKPMRKIGEGFYDPIGGECVDYYVDYQNKAWMATSPRSCFRVRLKKYDTNYESKIRNH